MGTMLAAPTLEAIKSRYGFSNGLCLSSRGKLGGMGFWWRDIEVDIKAYSPNYVYGEVLDHTRNPS